MNWVVIVLILIAAIGPVFWIMPSPRDRALVKMRSRARVLGLQVELTQVPDLAAEPRARVTAGGVRREPMRACAIYSLALPRPMRAAPHWRLVRNAPQGSGPLAGWQWDSPPVGDAGYWREVGKVLDELPADTLLCSVKATEVRCWWLERAPAQAAETAVDSLRDALGKLSDVQGVTDAANRVQDGEHEHRADSADER